MWNAIKPNELHKVFSLFLGERRNVETFFISFFTPLCPKWKAVDTVVSVTSSEWKTTYATFLPALEASKTKSQHATRASAQLCPTLCDPMNYSPSGSSIHGNSPAKNTGMDGHALLQGIFLTQESNWGLLHYSWIFYQESYQGSPKSYIRLHKKRMCTLYYSSLPSSEKAMTPHSSTLAWKIPRTEEPGRLQSMGSLRVGHDWATSLSLFTFTHWRRKWQPTPVFLPGESQGEGSLVGRRLWGHTELDMTEVT